MKQILLFLFFSGIFAVVSAQEISPEVHEIQEVHLQKKATGNLKKDAEIFGETKSVKQMKLGMSNYIHQKSDPKIMKAGPRDFVQPVGEGFFMGGSKYKWEEMDFEEFLVKELGEEFFTKDLKINKLLIQNFIFFVFKNFEMKEILKYGFCTEKDIARFVAKAEKDAPVFNSKKF